MIYAPLSLLNLKKWAWLTHSMTCLLRTEHQARGTAPWRSLEVGISLSRSWSTKRLAAQMMSLWRQKNKGRGGLMKSCKSNAAYIIKTYIGFWWNIIWKWFWKVKGSTRVTCKMSLGIVINIISSSYNNNNLSEYTFEILLLYWLKTYSLTY